MRYQLFALENFALWSVIAAISARKKSGRFRVNLVE